MPTVDILHTDRLILRPFVPEDRDALFALQGNPLVMRFYGNREPLSAGQADIVLDAHVTCRWKSYWAWAVTVRPDDACVGQVTALPVEWNGEHWIEMCWLLMPAMWGKGVGTEAVGAVLKHGRGALRWTKIMAGADEENVQSERIMVKNGMTFHGVEPDPHGRTRRMYTLL
jgi:ribosomal-protein-alanine N-acetyltransferase